MVVPRFIFLKKQNISNVEHQFLLIHRFRSDRGSIFTSEEDVMFSLTQDKYSILGYYDDSFNINERFIFLLEFPDHNCSYYFSQNINPKKAEHDQDVDMKNLGLACRSFISFAGFTRFSDPSVTYIDGVKTVSEQKWYFPIGQRMIWGGDIPSLENHGVKEIKLWAEIQDLTILNRFNSKCFDGSIRHKIHIMRRSLLFISFVVLNKN